MEGNKMKKTQKRKQSDQGSEIPLDGTKSYTPGPHPPLCAGVSVRGVGERTERADPRLPDREQPDPDWAQDHPHGGHGGGVGH